MMASSKSKSNIIPEKIQPSISPSRTFYSSAVSSSSSAFASSMAISFSPIRTSFGDRIYVASTSSVCFSIDRRNEVQIASNSSTRERSHQTSNHRNSSNKAVSNGKKKKCMCSPTTHPGSFRCSLHRNVSTRNGNQSNDAVSYHSHRLYGDRRSATMNSVVRIRTEGDLVKRYLASLIRPSSSHQQKRPIDFQPKPSRLSIMSKADE